MSEAADYVQLLEAVANAARAEVLAKGYRSTDMAKAMQALWGEFWFETYVPFPSRRCNYSYLTDMDDGPLVMRCTLTVHDSSLEHLFRPAYASDQGEHRG